MGRQTIESSFLGELLAKQAMVLGLKHQGLKVESALNEVNRQIKQAFDGDVISGKGVTKSGGED